MTKQQLPPFLSDLSFHLDNKRYQLFPVPDREGWFIFGLEDDGYYNYGVLVNFEQETAQIKTSHAIKNYHGGQSQTHTQWDDPKPDWYEAGSFEEWLREQVKIDIDRLLSWHFDELFDNYPVGKHLELYEMLCADFANLPDFNFTHYRNNSLKFNVLAAIHRSRTSAHISDADHTIFNQLIEELKTGDLFEQEEYPFMSIVLNLLPTIPDVILAYHDEVLAKVYDLSDCEDYNPLDFTSYWVQSLKYSTAKLRSVHHKHILPICNTSAMCHAIAAGIFHWPEEAELYIEKGLSLKPDNISLLMIAETFYLNHPKENRLEMVRRRIKKMNVKPTSIDNIQEVRP